MTEAMREQFEAWAVENGWSREGVVYLRNEADYGIYDLNMAWKGYQAALRSPAVAGLVEANIEWRDANKAFAKVVSQPNLDRVHAARDRLDAALAQYATLAKGEVP